jgi:endonuclease/exonuclease/phosphatase family metal-dependent hydrolase
MKYFISSAFFLFIFLCSSAQTNELKVMTFNIRYDNPSDNEYSWDRRKEMVFTVMNDYSPDIICIQEGLKVQVDQISENLKKYDHAGVGRDDGLEKGEYSAIFFASSRFTKMEDSTFWLSETPGVPGSRSWNAACTRIVTWVRLFDKKANRELLVFNTHFDHISVRARNESAKMLSAWIRRIAGKENVILTGDFNATDTSSAITFLTSPGSRYPMIDTRKLAGKDSFGPPYSFVGFPFHPQKDEIIDFIFIPADSGFRVMKSTIIDFHKDDKYPSDHLPVLTQLDYISRN